MTVKIIKYNNVIDSGTMVIDIHKNDENVQVWVNYVIVRLVEKTIKNIIMFARRRDVFAFMSQSSVPSHLQ